MSECLKNKKNYVKGKAMTTFSMDQKNRETLAEALDRLEQGLPLHRTSVHYLVEYNLWREGCDDCDDDCDESWHECIDESRRIAVWNRAFDPEIREEVKARRKARKAGMNHRTWDLIKG
tara:strand:+ start:278 stop:634 length:357 start_codon:yes stop_codon:yes gene_type:complete